MQFPIRPNDPRSLKLAHCLDEAIVAEVQNFDHIFISTCITYSYSMSCLSILPSYFYEHDVRPSVCNVDKL